MEYARDEKLFDDDVCLLDKISSPLLAKTIEAGRQVRLAAVHRWDIAAKDLWYAMLIPEMLEDKQRAVQVARVFDLVCAAIVPGANPLTLQALATALQTSEECTMPYQLCTFCEIRVEKALFNYCYYRHRYILDNNGWEVAEQGELPAWDAIWKEEKLKARQDIFPDEDGDLLKKCLSACREARNSAAHRLLEHEQELVVQKRILLTHTHNSMKTLVVLGNYEAALEVEIKVEQFFTKTTRDDILIRLRSCYLDQDLASVKDNHNFTRRRESGRRAAITRLLEVTSLPPIKTQRPMSDTGSESSTSTDPSLPTLTPPSSRSSSPSPSFLSEKS